MEEAIWGEELKGHDVSSTKKPGQECDRLKEITKNITRNSRLRAARTGGGETHVQLERRKFPSLEPGVLEGNNRGGAAKLGNRTK